MMTLSLRKSAVGLGYNSAGIYQFYSMAQGGSASAIKYKLNPNELSSLQQLFDRSEVGEYFQAISRGSISNQMLSSYYAEEILQGLEGQLHDGKLDIAAQPEEVDSLMDEVVIKEEQQRAIEMKARKAFIERQLESLKMQTITHKPLAQQDSSGLILSKDQHKQLVKRIKKQREEREKKHQGLLIAMQQKSREKEQFQQKQRDQRQKQLLKQRRQQIEHSLLKHKEQHEQLLKIQRDSKEKMKAISAHKFKYQQIQENYQRQVVLHNLEQKKRKLKEIRDYNSFNVEQLKQHERQYLEKKKLSQSRQTVNQDWKYQPPERSQRLAQIIQQQRMERIKKEVEKKKQLNEKLVRHEEYVTYLRENFVPKVDPAKKEELQKRIEGQKRQRTIDADPRQLGLAYLGEAKRRRKKIDKAESRPQTERNLTNPVNATNMSIGSVGDSKARAATNYLSIDHNGEHFEKRRRKNLERLVKNDQLDEGDKIKQLKFEAEKIGQNMQRKERELKYKKDRRLQQDTLELLLSSIQAKIGIIQMYQ